MNQLRAIETVGFIGLGIMGHHMAGHLLDGGHRLHVYNRTRAKAEALLEKGATWHDEPGDIAAVCDVVFTMVGLPEDVEGLYLSQGGLVARARPGSVLVDMTTSSPSLAQRVAEAAAARGLTALDAPVSGGDVGARDGTLSIMVGGEEGALDHVRGLLGLMGGNIVLQGGPGAGQHTKMANQIAIASTMMAVSESLGYAKKAGLDPHGVLGSIGKGAASSFLLVNLGPKMIDGDFAPGFYVRHFVKDMKIALEEARRMDIALPGLAQAAALYEQLVAAGHGEEGTQALFRILDGSVSEGDR